MQKAVDCNGCQSTVCYMTETLALTGLTHYSLVSVAYLYPLKVF